MLCMGVVGGGGDTWAELRRYQTLVFEKIAWFGGCVLAPESEREREKKVWWLCVGTRERERETVCVCVCVCARERVEDAFKEKSARQGLQCGWLF